MATQYGDTAPPTLYGGGILNAPIPPAPTGLGGGSTPSIPGPIPIQPPVLLYPPGGPTPNVPPPSQDPSASGAGNGGGCGGCGKSTAATTSAPAQPTSVRLATGAAAAPAPAEDAAVAPFPWWWLVAAAVIGYASRGRKRGR